MAWTARSWAHLTLPCWRAIMPRNMRQPAARSPDDSALLATGRRTLESERIGIGALLGRLDARFADACRALLACEGRVIVTGMGKSGHIAGKIAATLASTGTPS